MLEPDPAAVWAARRFVSGCLPGVAEDAVSTVELVVSELVTNAVLHAGTAVRIGVRRHGPVVRLEVGDQDRRSPTPREYRPEAGTGRGLVLVEALSVAWGVEAGPDGKTVWADIPLDPLPGGLEAGSVSSRSRRHGPPETHRSRRPRVRRPARPELVEVHFLAFPVAVSVRSAEHSDELRRELALILDREPAQGTGLPGRLLALVGEHDERFGRFGAEAQEVVRAAADQGRPTVDDLVYRVPREIGPVADRLDDLLEEADAYCRAGDLLTLATPEEARTFRRWFLGQLGSQARGRPAVAWPEWVTTQQA